MATACYPLASPNLLRSNTIKQYKLNQKVGLLRPMDFLIDAYLPER